MEDFDADRLYPELLESARRRLAEISPPKTKAEIYEVDMLEHDIRKLEHLIRARHDRRRKIAK